MIKSIHIEIQGTVQGVGFRPTVYQHADEAGVKGFVHNNGAGVIIEAEGEPDAIDRFVSRIQEQPPPHAAIKTFCVYQRPPRHFARFQIEESSHSEKRHLSIPPDMTVCDDCRHELFNPADRRFQYPFINCTNCGPRFTIIRSLPYDRERTSMSEFAMCPACRAEYTDPRSRRFDAQPNACPNCGPSLWLQDAQGNGIEGPPVSATAQLLSNGEIGLIKGLGGYHLCCNASDRGAVARLRERKNRPHKPFAVMCFDMADVRRYCFVPKEAEAELTSAASPIVILPVRPDNGLAENVSPDSANIGVFLSYTPLHALLLEQITPLVMTSANHTDEPIATTRSEADKLLGTVADFILDHNRPIERRADDSVVRIESGQRTLLRRSRGFVPRPLSFPYEPPPILACGVDVKNLFALTKGEQVILSQYIGDLADYRTYQTFAETVEDFSRLLQVHSEIVAYDEHPDYISNNYVKTHYKSAVKIPVQHHHAHIVSCMTEHHLQGKTIGVALDGSGYGSDGTVWGGEFLLSDERSFSRVAHFSPYPLPGGEAAVKNPVRMAYSVIHTDLNREEAFNDTVSRDKLSPEEEQTLHRMIENGIQTPQTSSVGRLFDAAAALLGVCDTVSYEGQAGVRLERLATPEESRSYPFALKQDKSSGCYRISLKQTFTALRQDREVGTSPQRIAAKFHHTIASAVTCVCCELRTDTSLRRVALSGGVFQNHFLLDGVERSLAQEGFYVYKHQAVPPNDGGMALGQAAVAAAKWQAGEIS